jgi:RNA polymerase sigma factor (sigma-70 family)
MPSPRSFSLNSVPIEFVASPWMAGDSGPRAGTPNGDLLASILAALATLSARERQTVQMRFGLSGEREQTLHEIALQLGVSRQRVHQLLQAALRRLRDAVSLSPS